MKAKIKKQWLKALRSDSYVQGNNYLVTQQINGSGDDEFCCLGVLCDVLGLEADFGVKDPHDIYSYGEIYGKYDDDEFILSPKVQRRTGLSGPDCAALAELNDQGFVSITKVGKGRHISEYRDELPDDAVFIDYVAENFNDIADFIEENL